MYHNEKNMIRRKVRKIDFNDKPYLIWNSFIDIVAMEAEDDLNEVQIIGQKAFIYDSEIQNGGHMQFFENTKLTNYKPFIDALKNMSAFEHANILIEAVRIYESKQRNEIKDKYEYSSIALDGEFDKLDFKYYRTKPELTELMQSFLKENEDQFIELTE